MPDLSSQEIEQRRVKRAERRALQRETNVKRAAKMHTERVTKQTDGNPIRDPVDPVRTVNVGCSGWYYWHWMGHFYPEGVARAEWFPIYQKHFDTVELNAPFYGWPTVATVKT